MIRPRATGSRSCSPSSAAAPERFAPYVDLYRRAAEQLGTTAHPVGMHSPGFIADTDEEARELYWPRYRVIRDRIGALRGWPPIRREEYERRDRARLPLHRLTQTVARKIARASSRHSASAGSTSSTPRDRAGRRAPARRRAVRHEGDPDGPRHPRRLTP